jgi:phosphomannomutase
VISAGLGSTDMLYYASGSLDLPGAMITASHNPPKYNGIKFCRAGAKPVGQDTGLDEIAVLVGEGVPESGRPPGTVKPRDLLSGYAEHLRTLVNLDGIRPLKVAVDAGNGMAGHTVPKVFEGLPLDLVPLFFELDGSFPNHEANPIDPANLRDLQQAVTSSGADIGLAFDGDADRCFLVDERGDIVSPSVLTALIAVRELARGATSEGADVIQGGLGSTDMVYYASGFLDVPGAMITASHNPAKYNGIKLCKAGAKPVGIETGLADIKQFVADNSNKSRNGESAETGTITDKDLLPGYVEYLRKLVDLSGIRPLKVVADAGNGMGGHTVPKVFDGLPVDLIPLYFELDGTFPNHEANPIDPKNLRDLQRAVKEHKADIGLAFDGDADRCFVVDERGEIVSPSVLTALIATRELKREKNGTVIHNLITSRAVPEIISENGGTPVRTRVGHSFIKAKMAETNAVFGGEHSGHFYFRDFWFADSGMLAALHTLAALGTDTRPLSQILGSYERYVASGEVNSEVADQAAVTSKVKSAYSQRPGVTVDELDGLTISGDDWWFNLRPSNTEPLLRLNVEASTEAAMASLRDEVLGIVRDGTIR